MTMFWKKLHFGREFSVISVDADAVRGCKFHRKGKSWKTVVFVDEPCDSENRGAALKRVYKQIGKSEFCAVTGSLENASFFRFDSTDMQTNYQRGAVEFELSRHMLKVPEKLAFQFCQSGSVADDPSAVRVNVAVFPKKSVTDFASLLRKNGVLADEFIHPFMAVDENTPALYLRDVEPDFYYNNCNWMPLPNEKSLEDCENAWLERFSKRFEIPEDPEFSMRKFCKVLLAADLISRGKLHRSPDAFKVLPDNIRPVRFRSHLIVSATLVVLLIGVLGWRFSVTYGRDIKEYRAILAETRTLKGKVSELKSSMRRNSKELKEMTRIAEMNIGEFDAVAEFALLSNILPNNVLVSSIRWNETDIDMILQCEDDALDIASLLQPLKYWKVGSQQQRQNGDSAVATITLKLVPYDAKVLK